MAGELKDNRRKAQNVLNRCLITLDADNIEPGDTQKILNLVDGLGCAYAIYSTRKHCQAKPRLRIIIPTDRNMLPDEYEPIARKIASFIGMDVMDPSTFEASRLMYWPSCSRDSEFVFKYQDRAFASCDGILKMYKNWKDRNEWPKIANEDEIIRKDSSGKKLMNPLEKKGVVGAFNRVYDIHSAIATFLSDIYESGNDPNKYHHVGSSTGYSAQVYEDGQHLFSYHATDAAYYKQCDAFRLVQIHKFGYLDNDTADDVEGAALPSYHAMKKFALEIPEVQKELNRAIFGNAKDNFKDVKVQEDNSNEWYLELERSESNALKKNANNIMLILENDPRIKR